MLKMVQLIIYSEFRLSFFIPASLFLVRQEHKGKMQCILEDLKHDKFASP